MDGAAAGDGKNKTETSTWLILGVLSLVAIAASIVVVSCSPASKADKDEIICTEGAYVFCRCQSRAEGTKLCTDEGTRFEKCQCGEDGTELPPLSPTGDAGFEEVDSGPPPTNPDEHINAKCAGKLAVLASSDEAIDLYGAAYGGQGAWTVAKSTGPALRSAPRGGLVGTSLVAVWRTRYNLIAWTKFQANQTTLSPPVSVGNAVTPARADFAGLGATGRVYYVGTDDKIEEGEYSPTGGWDDATTLVATTAPEKTAPAVSFLDNNIILAYASTDGSLSTQTQSGTAWSTPAPIAGAKAYEETPAMTPLISTSQDLLLVYVGSDLILHSTTRAKSGSVWGAPVLVDTGATPDGGPAIAPMSKGRAMLVYRGTNGSPFYSVYDPAKTPLWSAPASFFSGKQITLASPPSLGSGRCAAEVTTTYVDKDGNVNLAFYTGTEWLGPFPVPGMTKMTFAGAGEVP